MGSTAFSISSTAVCRASHCAALGPVQMQSAVPCHQALPAKPGVLCAQGKKKGKYKKGEKKKEKTYVSLELKPSQPQEALLGHASLWKRAETCCTSEFTLHAFDQNCFKFTLF